MLHTWKPDLKRHHLKGFCSSVIGCFIYKSHLFSALCARLSHGAVRLPKRAARRRKNGPNSDSEQRALIFHCPVGDDTRASLFPPRPLFSILFPPHTPLLISALIMTHRRDDIHRSRRASLFCIRAVGAAAKMALVAPPTLCVSAARVASDECGVCSCVLPARRMAQRARRQHTQFRPKSVLCRQVENAKPAANANFALICRLLFQKLGNSFLFGCASKIYRGCLKFCIILNIQFLLSNTQQLKFVCSGSFMFVNKKIIFQDMDNMWQINFWDDKIP